MRHFLIYYGGGQGHGHNVAFLACAETPLAAIHTYLQSEDGATVTDEGEILVDVEGVQRRYPHALAFIETAYRPWREWLIREIPERAWSQPLTEVMCGEAEGDVDEDIRKCRDLFPDEKHRSAWAFAWYLRDGMLVTFYEMTDDGEIQVIIRFIRRWVDGAFRPWRGSYEELLDQLFLGPQTAP